MDEKERQKEQVRAIAKEAENKNPHLRLVPPLKKIDKND